MPLAMRLYKGEPLRRLIHRSPPPVVNQHNIHPMIAAIHELF